MAPATGFRRGPGGRAHGRGAGTPARGPSPTSIASLVLGEGVEDRLGREARRYDRPGYSNADDDAVAVDSLPAVAAVVVVRLLQHGAEDVRLARRVGRLLLQEVPEVPRVHLHRLSARGARRRGPGAAAALHPRGQAFGVPVVVGAPMAGAAHGRVHGPDRLAADGAVVDVGGAGRVGSGWRRAGPRRPFHVEEATDGHVHVPPRRRQRLLGLPPRVTHVHEHAQRPTPGGGMTTSGVAAAGVLGCTNGEKLLRGGVGIAAMAVQGRAGGLRADAEGLREALHVALRHP
mmetsp:Transcript_15222/g.43528  ORF Transcript_15222/g.43528 Transcript_15222/m.43528 type:complete len:289 (-) Transcript_15222:54-920(-)